MIEGVKRQPLNFGACGSESQSSWVSVFALCLSLIMIVNLEHSLIVWIFYNPLKSEQETLKKVSNSIRNSSSNN